MAGNEEKIKELEEEIRKTQYNKATQHHIGLLKAKIAKLKEDAEKKASGGSKGEGYSVRKTGDGSLVMLGLPSVGKSTLLNTLTNAESEVGAYEFTTLDVIPGMMELNGAQIQVLDVPGILKGAASGKGRGKEVLSVLRSADLCLIVVDVYKPEAAHILRKEVYDAGLRLDQKPPLVKVTKKEKGGINIGTTVKLTHTDEDTLKDVTKEMGFYNADIIVREDVTVDRFIDGLKSNRVYMPSLTVLNKSDLEGAEKAKRIAGAEMMISARDGNNLELLKQEIWKRLDLMRIYMKEPGKDPDMDEPLVLKRDSTIKDACIKLHKDIAKRLKFARVTGPSAKFEGQKLSDQHTLQDEDILELHLR